MLLIGILYVIAQVMVGRAVGITREVKYDGNVQYYPLMINTPAHYCDRSNSSYWGRSLSSLYDTT